MLITKYLLKQGFEYRWYTMQTLIRVLTIGTIFNHELLYTNSQTFLIPRGTSSPEPTPSPSPSLKDSPSCVVVGNALGTCNSNAPGFTTLDPKDQAQCLCYSNTGWQPDFL